MEKCPSCGENYKKISNHWQFNESHRPKYSSKQHEIVKGLMLGDGSLDLRTTNAGLQVTSIKKEYLEYLKKHFGILANSVKLKTTAEESKNYFEEHNKVGDKDYTFSDIYRLTLKNHPALNRYRSWYASGDIEFPENLKLTPVAMTHWYCGDGSLYHDETHKQISIAMANESENTGKIDKIFKDSGLPIPSSYNIRDIDGTEACDARFTKSQTEELFKYMNEAPPGFQYKWP